MRKFCRGRWSDILWNRAVAAGCGALLLLFCGLPDRGETRPQNLRELTAIGDRLLETTVQYGDIPALFRPAYIRVPDADLSMMRDDPVFIVRLPGGARIYPQRIMVWHQVINEIIADRAYAVTYCPMTGSLAAYDAYMGGMNLFFDPEGRLYQGNSVLMDRNSGSLWLQMDGVAFRGGLTGRGMPQVPVFWTTWAHARTVFPDAKVLAAPSTARAYNRDPYGSYFKRGTYYDNDILIYPVSRIDHRLPKKNSVLCLDYKGTLLAVDVSYVKKKGAVNFFVGGDPLVALYDGQLGVVRIFNRFVWQKPSLFVMKNGLVTDLGTGTVWDPSTGRAVQGNMRGASMKEYWGMYSMWFAWAALNPETMVIPGPGEVPDSVLTTPPSGLPPRRAQQ